MAVLHRSHVPRYATPTRDGRHSEVAIKRRRWRHLPPRLRFGPRRHRLETHRLALREWPDAGLAEGEEPGFSAQHSGEEPLCRSSDVGDLKQVIPAIATAKSR